MKLVFAFQLVCKHAYLGNFCSIPVIYILKQEKEAFRSGPMICIPIYKQLANLHPIRSTVPSKLVVVD